MIECKYMWVMAMWSEIVGLYACEAAYIMGVFLVNIVKKG